MYEFRSVCRQWMTFRVRQGLCLLLLLGSVNFSPAPVAAAPADDEYTLGLTLYGQKRWDLAAETLRSYLKNYPEHGNVPLAKLYLSQSYVNLRDYRQARDQLREFLKEHPQNKNLSQALYRVAECSYFLDDFATSAAEFETFLKQFPNDPLAEWALPYLGDSYLRTDEPATAAARFQQSLEKFPQGRFLEDSRFGLARSLELKGESDAAFAEYQKLIAMPESKRAPEAMINVGMLAFREQDFAKSAATFTALSQKYPSNPLVPLARLNAGYAWFSLEKWDQALAEFEAVARGPVYAPNARFWIAQTFQRQGKLKDAETQLVALQKLEQPDDLRPQVMFLLADIRFDLAQYEQAESGFREYLTTWPQGTQAETAWLRGIEACLLNRRLGRGWELASQNVEFTLSPAGEQQRLLLQSRLLAAGESPEDPLPAELGSREEQIARAQSLLEPLVAQLTPASDAAFDQQLRFQAARIAQIQQQWSRVVELLDSLTRQRAAGTPLLVPEAWLLLATALVETRQYEAALAAVQEFRQLDAGTVDLTEQALLIRFTCLIETGQLDAAEREFLQLQQPAQPTEPWWRAGYQLAEAAYARSNWALAERQYRLMLAARPNDAWLQKVLSGLGWTQFENGQFEQAGQTFQEIEQKFPGVPQVTADASYMRAMAALKAGRNEPAAIAFLETARKFASDADQPAPEWQKQVAYKAAREAARAFRQLNNIEQAAAGYELAFQQLDQLETTRKTQLDKLLDEWALLHYEHEEYDKADEVFRLLVEKMPDSERADAARLSLAESEYLAGRIDAAATQFEALLNRPATDLYVQRRARYQRVLIAAEQQDWPGLQTQAQAYLDQFDSRQVPLAEWGEVQTRLIQACLEQDDRPTASRQIEILFKELEQPVPNPAELRWWPGLYVQAAELARRDKNYPRVRELLQQIQQKFPESDERNQLEVIAGRTYIAEADFVQARAQFQGVIDRSGGKKSLASAQSQFYLAETSLMKKEYDRALKEYLRVAVLFPGFPDLQMAAMYQAGQCDEALGHPTQALESYESLIRQFPDSEYAAKSQLRVNALQK